MMLGSVDQINGHCIATKFVGLVIPVSSMYVMDESTERAGNVTTTTWSGVPIRFNLKSAALAYPRVWLPIAAVVLPFVKHWGENVSRIPNTTWWTSAALIALAFLFLIPGRLSKREKRRLSILGGVLGLYIDPAKLYDLTRETKRLVLEDGLEKVDLPTTPAECAAIAKDVPVAALPMLYTFACYSKATPEWQKSAAAIFAQIEERAPSL